MCGVDSVSGVKGVGGGLGKPGFGGQQKKTTLSLPEGLLTARAAGTDGAATHATRATAPCLAHDGVAL